MYPDVSPDPETYQWRCEDEQEAGTAQLEGADLLQVSDQHQLDC